MGVGSYQPLAEGKGVRSDAKSEGSRKQNLELRNTNNIRHILNGRVCQTKRIKLPSPEGEGFTVGFSRLKACASSIVHYCVESVQKVPHIVIASEAKQARIPARSDLQPLSLYAILCFIVMDCFVPRNDDRGVLSVDE
jgi:hypothetical protein